MEEEKRKENEKSQWEKGEEKWGKGKGIREEGKGIKNTTHLAISRPGLHNSPSPPSTKLCVRWLQRGKTFINLKTFDKNLALIPPISNIEMAIELIIQN